MIVIGKNKNKISLRKHFDRIEELWLQRGPHYWTTVAPVSIDEMKHWQKREIKSGEPLMYAVDGKQIHFSPTTDKRYKLKIHYALLNEM